MRRKLKFDKRLKMNKDIYSFLLKAVLFLLAVIVVFSLIKASYDLREKAVKNCVQYTELGEVTCRYLAR